MRDDAKEPTSSSIEFTLCPGSYADDFLPVYQKLNLSPRSIFQIGILLPFELTMESGTCLTIQVSTELVRTFIFHPVLLVERLRSGLLSPAGQDVEAGRTRVEMNCLSSKEKLVANESDVSLLFDDLLHSLNSILQAYELRYGDTSVFPITKEMVEFSSFYRMGSLPDWNCTTGMLILNLNFPNKKAPLDREATAKFIEYYGSFVAHDNPFFRVDEFMMEAHRYLRMGFYEWSVTSAQIAIETLVRSVYWFSASLDGLPENEINDALEHESFVGMLKRKMPEILGGNWNLANSNSDLGNWYLNCYRVRNRIQHAGYRTTASEAELALDSAKGMINFVAARIRHTKRLSGFVPASISAEKAIRGE
jgi:hypothetical protein